MSSFQSHTRRRRTLSSKLLIPDMISLSIEDLRVNFVHVDCGRTFHVEQSTTVARVDAFFKEAQGRRHTEGLICTIYYITLLSPR